MSNIIDTLEQEQFKQNLPNFNPGDTLVVQVKVREGNRERLQAFEGVCIPDPQPARGFQHRQTPR